VNTLRGRFFLYFLLGAVATTALTVLVATALARRFVERRGLRSIELLARPAVGTTAGRSYVVVLILSGLIGAGIAALLAYALSTRLTSPIRQLSDATRRVASGEAAQVPVEGTDELAQLATSFNLMSGQLSRARESERAFLLSVSHELKTPLTAIRGYGEALKDGAASADEAGPIIERESERLQRLVQDLLDLARLDQRAFTIRQEPVDLADVARTVEELLRPRAAEFGVGLSVQTSVAGSVFADRDRAIQVVANLVENALRVTPANGAVTIRTGDATIAVQDTGPGLTPDDQVHAFDRFFLYRRYGADRPVGSGLGLAIVKELTAAMNGSVAIASEPGAGATFTIRLPLAPARPDASAT
jgi:signal transduction histidine kinase